MPHRLLGRATPPRVAATLAAMDLGGYAARLNQQLPTGLASPWLEATGAHVMGADVPGHRIENKHRWKAILATQLSVTHWTMYKGEFELPPPPAPPVSHRGEMCPSGLALHIQPLSFSQSGPPMAATLALDCPRHRRKCRRWWIEDHIVRLCPTKPSLISKQRSRRRLRADKQSLRRASPLRTTHLNSRSPLLRRYPTN